MSDSSLEVRTTDQARLEAERHRRELAHTLDMLAAKLNHTVERAEETRERVREKVDDLEAKARRPLEWVKENPLPALGIGLAAGLLLSLGGGRKKRHTRRLPELNPHFGIHTRLLQHAYMEGRKDEAKGKAIRPLLYWKDFQPRDSASRELITASGQVLKSVKAAFSALFHGARALQKRPR